jgi:hypothetical protein
LRNLFNLNRALVLAAALLGACSKMAANRTVQCFIVSIACFKEIFCQTVIPIQSAASANKACL